VTHAHRDGAVRFGIRLVLSVILGWALMPPLAWLYEAFDLPTFHGWGLLHGGFFSALPTVAIIAFLLLGALPWLRWHADTMLLVAAAGTGLYLTSLIAVTGSYRQDGTLTTLCGAGMIAAIVLCWPAYRRWLVALFIVLPLMLMEAPIMLLVGRTNHLLAHVWFGGLRSWIPMGLLVLSGMWIARILGALTARYADRRRERG
jgi:hypothetical protein